MKYFILLLTLFMISACSQFSTIRGDNQSSVAGASTYRIIHSNKDFKCEISVTSGKPVDFATLDLNEKCAFKSSVQGVKSVNNADVNQGKLIDTLQNSLKLIPQLGK